MSCCIADFHSVLGSNPGVRYDRGEGGGGFVVFLFYQSHDDGNFYEVHSMFARLP